MREILRGGRGLSYDQGVKHLSNHPTKEKNTSDKPTQEIRRKQSECISQIAYTLPMIIFCVLFSGLLVSPAFGQEANGLKKIELLKVGDEIPEAIWNLPIKVVNHSEGKEFIKLSDYRDKKLIILDFWGTWCSSCIKAFPLTKKLEDKFGQDILVVSLTEEKSDKIKTFIATNEIAKSVNLWSVVEDSVITKLIDKYTYPHFTWIAEGKIISNTSHTALKEEFVGDYLSKKTIGWAEKVNLNPNKSYFLTLGDLSSSSHSYYIEGLLDGAGKMFGAMPYGNGRTNHYFINYTQREIFELLLNRIANSKDKNSKIFNYSSDFKNSKAWQDFNENLVSLQIITNQQKPLIEVLERFITMFSVKIEQNSVGEFTLHKSYKEAKL